MLLQQRNLAASGTPPRTAANAIPEDAILDAAHELVLAVGVRKLSMADLARKAEVSRTTLYRRWPSSKEVLATLFTRELGDLAAGLGSGASTSRDELVEAVVGFVHTVRAHPLVRKVVEVDPEFLTPYVFERPGSSVVLMQTALEAGLRHGMEEGWVREGSAAILARTVLLSCWSFVLTAPALVAPEEYADLDHELATLIDRYLS